MLSKPLSVLLIASTLLVSMTAEAAPRGIAPPTIAPAPPPPRPPVFFQSPAELVFESYKSQNLAVALSAENLQHISREDALAYILEQDPSHAKKIFTDAIDAFPGSAATFLKLAITAYPNLASDFLSAALTAAPTPEARRALAAVASEAGISLTVINSVLKTVTTKNGSYEVFSVKGDNTSKVQTVTETTSTVNGNITTSTTSTQSASGGGGCNKQIASCS